MMKKMIYILLTGLLIMSCNNEDDRIFPESSDSRSSGYIASFETLLAGSDQGWKMLYYPKASEYGGFNFLFKFTDKRVTMKADLDEDSRESTWSVNMSQGPVLSFDTYNLIHLLSDPQYVKKAYGMEGDFEFIVSNYTENEIRLLGRKRQAEVILTRASAADWTDMDAIQKAQRDFELGEYEALVMKINGVVSENASVSWDTDIHVCNIIYYDEDGAKVKQSSPYALTTDGCKFSNPMNIGDVVLTGLKIVSGPKPGDRKFVSTDAGGAIELTIVVDAPLGLSSDMIPAYEPDPAIRSVDLMRSKYKEYRVTMMSTGLQKIADKLKADLPDFVEFRVVLDRNSNNPGAFTFVVNEGGVAKYYWYGFDEFVMLNNSENQTRFYVSGATGSTNSYSPSGWEGRKAYTGHAAMTDMRTKFFFLKTGHTVIYDYYDTYWIRNIANPNDWWKIEAIK